MTRARSRARVVGYRRPVRWKRGATLVIVGGLALAVIRIAPRTPAARPPLQALTEPAADSQPTPAADSVEQRVDTLRAGETIGALLLRGGVEDSIAARVLGAATTLDERRLPAGMSVALRGAPGDSTPSEIIFHLSEDRTLHVRRTGSAWTAEEVKVPWRTDTVIVAGKIRSTLYEALDEAEGAREMPRQARAELAWTLADIFEYRVDMSRELQVGDDFRAVIARAVSPKGGVRIEEVLAARFTLSGSAVEAIRYQRGSSRAEYFDQDGKSLRLAFLRAPLSFRRISSVFGRRKHPILGTWRAHKGTDYAASSGTPVRAIGDGVVVYAGWRGGYGNTLEIRHRNGYVTRYGHLRGFARGVRRGTRVDIGQTVAYVGMSGLATGPHLHFEVLVNGVQRDPRTALASKAGEPVPASERAGFESRRTQLLALLDGLAPVETVAQQE
ncbi:MAG TPA: M23 family metallopeptidase [Gemmatimonadaceae bacterium]|nr:M23 family metallopeptidase [Gemmatimonadaceae bacterium]